MQAIPATSGAQQVLIEVDDAIIVIQPQPSAVVSAAGAQQTIERLDAMSQTVSDV